MAATPTEALELPTPLLQRPGEGLAMGTYLTHLVRSHVLMLSTVTGPLHTFLSCRWVPR